MRHKRFPSLGSDLGVVFPLLTPQPQPLGSSVALWCMSGWGSSAPMAGAAPLEGSCLQKCRHS